MLQNTETTTTATTKKSLKNFCFFANFFLVTCI